MAHRLMVIPGDSEDLRALPDRASADFDIQLIENANDALWEVRTTPPDVIIANVDLPGMTGLDLAEILPNFGVPTRVVLWSGSANPQASSQAAEFGARFVAAPLTPEELRNALQAALQDAQTAAADAAAEEAAAAEAAAAEAAAAEAAAAAQAAPEAATPEAPAERARRMHDVPAAPPERERTRRAHDVAPAPPERERTRRAHDVSPAPQSLAERARRAAQAEQSNQPPEPPASKPGHTRQGALVLTVDNLKPIRSRMEALEREVGSQCIMLADRAGMLLAECGITSGLPTMILLPLLSTSFSTAGQISQMLREKESSALYMHEGVNYDVYCFDVLQSYMLVIVFSKSSGSQVAKIGSVWVYAKRAIRDIEEILG